jgi:signal-transduction protein with cAMP-binding, CBS, and nucleotidyltransferase domain
MTCIRWFAEPGVGDVPLVGGKNASLGEMFRELGAHGVRVLGMLSAADMLHPEAARRDTGRLKARQVCAYKPLAVDADTPATEVARQMLERQVHHVVVMRQHDLPGVISALDFVKRFPAKNPA